MGTKETPINFRVYYKNMTEYYTHKKEDLLEELATQTKALQELHESIQNNLNSYKSDFNTDLNKYKEFVENKYIDGQFLRVTKGMYMNKSNNYELVGALVDVYTLARLQKHIVGIEKEIDLCERCLKVDIKTYNSFLKQYYGEVHRKMILEGNGYAFSGSLGWICINRCVLRNSKPKLDFAATKKRKAELQAAGVKLYNETEAEWCKQHGIPYKAADYRVYLNKEHCYEIPLINCKLPNGSKIKFTVTDYRNTSLRGKTNDDIIRECNSDTSKICDLGLDLKTKLTLCEKVDKILYTKFIRNENQKPLVDPSPNR